MNFFLDTPIITEITLEIRTNVYDMISAVGGTLGLFTGISVITVVEVVYWIGRFLKVGFKSTFGFRQAFYCARWYLRFLELTVVFSFRNFCSYLQAWLFELHHM